MGVGCARGRVLRRGRIDPRSCRGHEVARRCARRARRRSEHGRGRRADSVEWRYDAERHVISGSPPLGTQLAKARATRRCSRARSTAPMARRSSAGQEIGSSSAIRRRAGRRRPTRTRRSKHCRAEGRDRRHRGVHDAAGERVLVEARNVIAKSRGVPRTDGRVRRSRDRVRHAGEARRAARPGDARDQRAASGLERWGTDNPTGMAHDHIAVVATGTTTIARFAATTPAPTVPRTRRS